MDSTERTNRLFQQGDVLLFQVNPQQNGMTETKRLTDQRGVVLAEGEVTGHAHTLPASDVAVLERDDETFVKVDQPTTLRHQTHGPINLNIGLYKLRHVQEADPFEDAVKRVAD